MTTSITIAHLTDVHLGPIAGFGPRYWNLKRAAGYYNWMRHRRSAYRRDVLDRIVADMSAQQPDHIVVTGDLANIGLPQEHVNALAWLKALGPPERVSVVPGNHDIYSRIGRDPGTRRWAPYMASDAQGAEFVRTSGRFSVRAGAGAGGARRGQLRSANAAAHGLGPRRTRAARCRGRDSRGSRCVPISSASCSSTIRRCPARHRVRAACWTQPHWKMF